MQNYLTNNAEETQKIGEQLAQYLKGGEVLALTGDLGYGKTTFVQGLAKGLGVTHRIISPTFVIVRQYEITEKEYKTFYHIDLYRIESKKDLENIGIQEILNDKNAIIVVEWPEKLGEMLPEKRIDIDFEYLDETRRKMEITSSLI